MQPDIATCPRAVRTHRLASPGAAAIAAGLALAVLVTACGRRAASGSVDDEGGGASPPQAQWGHAPVLAPDLEPAAQDTTSVPDDPDQDTTSVPDDPDERAACVRGTIDGPERPVDVIVLIGGYGSASREIPWISVELSALHRRLEAKGLDPRVILVGGPDLCVYPPLGAGDCGETEDYRHLPLWIRPEAAPSQLVDSHEQYRDRLRPDSARLLIWLSDARLTPPPAGDAKQLTRELQEVLGEQLSIAVLVSQLHPADGPCFLPAPMVSDPLPVAVTKRLGGYARQACGRQRWDIEAVFAQAERLIAHVPPRRCP